jgi:hypothetical protein
MKSIEKDENIKMNPYKNGKIYKIVSSNYDKYYIGSTKDDLDTRFITHKNAYERYRTCKGGYSTSCDIFEKGDTCIELIKNFECYSKAELEHEEHRIICESNTELIVNKRGLLNLGVSNSIADKKEYSLKYQAVQKDRLVVCECGKTVSQYQMTRHLDGQYHRAKCGISTRKLDKSIRTIEKKISDLQSVLLEKKAEREEIKKSYKPPEKRPSKYADIFENIENTNDCKCLTCNKIISQHSKGSHVKTKKHIMANSPEKCPSKYTDIFENIENTNDCKCLTCNRIITQHSRGSHVKSKKHIRLNSHHIVV